jgi:hypothetical protein
VQCYAKDSIDFGEEHQQQGEKKAFFRANALANTVLFGSA